MNTAVKQLFNYSPGASVEDTKDTDIEVNLAAAELLIVDDDEAALERLKLFAEDAGYMVHTARDGEQALQRLQSRFCALLLTDIIMPGMSGSALCESIRRTRFPSYVYVIALSVRDGSDDIAGAMSAGADDFLSKRATRSELLARLRTGRRVVGLERALRQTIAEKAKLCDVDALTGCFNKRYLLSALQHELRHCAQRGHPLSIVCCDIDQFKRLNDTHGPAVGNEVLQHVGARLGHAVAQEAACWIAYGGDDEFVVVLPAAPIERARASAEAIARAVASEPIACSAGAIPLSLGIGVCGVAPAQLRRVVLANALIDEAQQATRDAKALGGNSVSARAFRRRGALVSVRTKPRNAK